MQAIKLPTDTNRDLGFVLLFLGLVTHYAVPPLAGQFGFTAGRVAYLTAPLGLVLFLAGICMIFFARKVIHVGNGQLRIKDGFLARPLTLRYDSVPTVKLSGYEENRNGHADEIWTVHLNDDGRQYLIDRSVGHHAASRSLAERLAKVTGGSLIEVHEGKSHKFELSELDLSFVERVAKYPEMMGIPVEKPSETPLRFERTDSGLEANWSFFHSGLIFELAIVVTLLLAAAFIPLPGGPDGGAFTLYQVERSQNDYMYFSGVAFFAVLALALLAGYRNTLSLDLEKGAVSQATIWGIPVRTGKIPIRELEHLGVSINSRGPYLVMISDKKILKEMLPSTYLARWLTWEMKTFLSTLDPKSLNPTP